MVLNGKFPTNILLAIFLEAEGLKKKSSSSEESSVEVERFVCVCEWLLCVVCVVVCVGACVGLCCGFVFCVCACGASW